jgi:BASS family bile acid:Na+ symporter
MALIFLGVGLDFRAMVSLLGPYGILAGVIFIVVSFVIGYLLGGSHTDTRSVMGLGTAQRNISAALVVAGQHFNADVVASAVIIGVIGLVILMLTSAELGKRVKREEAGT